MAETFFDHEKLDVDRLSIEYAAPCCGVARTLTGPNRYIRDQWLRAAQSIPWNNAEGNGKQKLKDKNRYLQIARGSALECAAVHDLLLAFAVLDEEANRQGKSQLKRIVSLRFLESTDPALGDEPPSMYAVTLRLRSDGRRRLMDNWYHRLTIGQPLPTLPLWLTPTQAIALDLESSYEETCRTLRIR